MLVVYKKKHDVWDRVGELSSVAYDTDEKIAKGIKKLESTYLFNHHAYLAESADTLIHFENGKIQEVWNNLKKIVALYVQSWDNELVRILDKKRMVLNYDNKKKQQQHT